MDGCPSVHEHPEFQSSYDPKDKVQNREIQKLKRFLKSDAGHSIGEPLRHVHMRGLDQVLLYSQQLQYCANVVFSSNTIA